MDIATSTISNIVTAGVPHAAQEARRDSMARETIPQINQNAQSANNAAVSQGSVQTAPVNSSLFIQTDVLIKANGEKVSSKKELAKTEKKEDTKETKGTGGGKAASSSSASDVYKDAMWHEHKTSFNNASVNEIAKMLENIYDVQVVVDPTIDQENTYSGVIKEKETIDSVLDLLQNTLPIHYHVKGSKVFITK